jgi:hypothetical protein
MEIIIQRFIIILIICIIIFVIFYWNSNIYKQQKFRIFFTILSAVAVVFSVLAITIQTFSFSETLSANNTNSYNQLSDLFFGETFRMFLENEDMKYFYNDLLDIKHIDENTSNRNITKEHQMAMLIFHRSIPIIYYIINNNYDNIKTRGLISRYNHVMHTFFKSKVFRNYWKDYEIRLAGDPPRVYFKKEFNLNSNYWNDPSLEPEYNPTYTFKN